MFFDHWLMKPFPNIMLTELSLSMDLLLCQHWSILLILSVPFIWLTNHNLPFIWHRFKQLRYSLMLNLICYIKHHKSSSSSSTTETNNNNNHHRYKTHPHSPVSNPLATQSTTNIYQLSYPPGPLCLPVIGHLHLLARYGGNPWYAFDQIRRHYGNVVWLQLGHFRTVLVSTVPAIREVLLAKGEHFANRPHFNRHALYFSMDRQNALALCDWSPVHKQRRSIAHAAVIPRFGTKCFQRLSSSVTDAIEHLFKDIAQIDPSKEYPNEISLSKHYIIELSCRVFFHFLMEQNDMENFSKISHTFDLVFDDINQMYLSDFLPWLQHFGPIRRYYRYLIDHSNWVFEQVEKLVKRRFEIIKQNHINNHNTINTNTTNIDPNEQCPETELCDERFVDRILLNKQYNNSARFLDFILEHYLENEQTMSWSEMMYEIGDLLGGNSAVGNLLYRVIGHLALNQQAQNEIYEQIKMVAQRKANERQQASKKASKIQLTIEDQHDMPMVSAAIMETLRLALSPIVPHLSRCDTSLQGYFIPKGTMVLFNIYHLNLSDQLYDEPFKFNPKRFITDQGQMLKPEHFFPFSHGRRSCLGYKMVNTIISATVANILLNYKIIVPSHLDNMQQHMREMLQPKGTVSLPHMDHDCYQVALVARND